MLYQHPHPRACTYICAPAPTTTYKIAFIFMTRGKYYSFSTFLSFLHVYTALRCDIIGFNVVYFQKRCDRCCDRYCDRYCG
ncbi:uncharacterized protein F4817DRAFT_340718 [Daldinia loculata]|uniref:uncharacterized protein n=1 Tax=Daldinia loculata TaxID=103429 RepID=UPI0020C51E97|nr:uncharacterized protein F4817DRAFT_340718 [Daldinia loculata]KAI1646399.1 hypothetical protein F4817DRAFT_340718 [Daldinia loculata]